MKKTIKLISLLLSVLMITTIITALPLSADAAVAAKSIKLNTSTLTMTAGTKYTLKATISPSNTSNKTVYWSSGNKSVLTVAAGGVLTAKAAGTSTVTAKTKNGKTATCKVTVVKKGMPTSIKVSYSAITMTAGTTTKILKATITPSNATNKTVYWSSSDATVAGMQNGGIIKAKKAGTCTITAKTANGFKASCKITVKAKSSGSTSDYDWYLENNNKLINFIKSLATKQSNGDYGLKQTIKSGSSGEVIIVTAKASGGIRVEDYDYFTDDGIGYGYYYTKIEWDLAKNGYNATGYMKKYYTSRNMTDKVASGSFNILTYNGEQGSFPNVDYGRLLRGCINDTLESLDTFCYCSELDYMRVYSLGFQGIPRKAR